MCVQRPKTLRALVSCNRSWNNTGQTLRVALLAGFAMGNTVSIRPLDAGLFLAAPRVALARTVASAPTTLSRTCFHQLSDKVPGCVKTVICFDSWLQRLEMREPSVPLDSGQVLKDGREHRLGTLGATNCGSSCDVGGPPKHPTQRSAQLVERLCHRSATTVTFVVMHPDATDRRRADTAELFAG